jgi:hypothetical protein
VNDEELWDELCKMAIEPGVMRHQSLGEGLRARVVAHCHSCRKQSYHSKTDARKNRSRFGETQHIYRCPQNPEMWHLTTVSASKTAQYRKFRGRR